MVFISHRCPLNSAGYKGLISTEGGDGHWGVERVVFREQQLPRGPWLKYPPWNSPFSRLKNGMWLGDDPFLFGETKKGLFSGAYMLYVSLREMYISPCLRVTLREKKDIKHRVLQNEKPPNQNGPGFGEERDGPYQNDVTRFCESAAPLLSAPMGRVVFVWKKKGPRERVFLRRKNGVIFGSQKQNMGRFFVVWDLKPFETCWTVVLEE